MVNILVILVLGGVCDGLNRLNMNKIKSSFEASLGHDDVITRKLMAGARKHIRAHVTITEQLLTK